jgi:hypothetical protein
MTRPLRGFFSHWRVWQASRGRFAYQEQARAKSKCGGSPVALNNSSSSSTTPRAQPIRRSPFDSPGDRSQPRTSFKTKACVSAWTGRKPYCIGTWFQTQSGWSGSLATEKSTLCLAKLPHELAQGLNIPAAPRTIQLLGTKRSANTMQRSIHPGSVNPPPRSSALRPASATFSGA